ncbi:MAG TPA: AAA domain-containing protein [Erysipelotrichaceae bacterium]|nr:AAA domain-containing protein [Erysipelotrichaceae bacterium]
MSAYFEFLREIFIRVLADIGNFFYRVFVMPWTDVGENFSFYGAALSAHMGGFGFWGWFFFVLFALLLLGLVGGIVFIIVSLLRKYIRFVKKELDKEELGRQIERLNYELFQAVQEKDKILNLKVGYMGLKTADYDEESKETIEEVSSRFPKLFHVDNKYRGVNVDIPPREDLSLEELCNAFRNFAASQLHLYYREDVIKQLFAGIATSKLIILEGISGTGKTSLALAVGKFFNFDSAIIPVQPSWKDRSELLGYYNEFTKKFNETEFLRALYTTTYRKDLNVIILDEMNLARIEYYFAEFLSIMEMRDPNDWVIDLIPFSVPNDPVNLKDGKLLIPQNVMFFGTANNDDSTFTISDKVYDRAISIFFDDKGREFEAPIQESMSVPYSQLKNLFDEAVIQYPISQAAIDKFEQLDNFIIKKFKLAFGNRILKQLDTFIPVYVACGGKEVDGFDFIFTNKILKKFESLNISFLKNELKELDAQLDKMYGRGNFQMAHSYIETLLKNN